MKNHLEIVRIFIEVLIGIFLSAYYVTKLIFALSIFEYFLFD